MTDRGRLRSADDLLSAVVADTLSRLELGEVDQAAAGLARAYAAAIDQAPRSACEDCGADPRAKLLEQLGPRLLAALVELGATPKARKAIGPTAVRPGGKLEHLRAHRVG